MTKLTQESNIESWYCDQLKERGVTNTKLTQAHWPDRIFLANGLFVLVEFKDPSGDARPGQRAKIVELTKLGFPIWIISKKSEKYLAWLLQSLGICVTFTEPGGAQ